MWSSFKMYVEGVEEKSDAYLLEGVAQPAHHVLVRAVWAAREA